VSRGNILLLVFKKSLQKLGVNISNMEHITGGPHIRCVWHEDDDSKRTIMEVDK
jgi:hypothetical protein